jgi:competence protein ComEA
MKRLVEFIGAVCLPLVAIAGPVNVNTADAEAISNELKGIGLSKARAIVEYRSAHGDFTVPEDLLAVKGIGAAVLRDNPGDIIVSD